jgi:hypothetical protein
MSDQQIRVGAAPAKVQVIQQSRDADWARARTDALIFRSSIDAAVALMWINEHDAEAARINPPQP